MLTPPHFDGHRLLGDHLGSTAYTVSGASEFGEVRYRAFGATRFTSGTTPTTYRRVPPGRGQREESALGLYYYGARWYDPALGHFLQPDTMVPQPGNVLDYHRYSYTRFNPLKYNDPTGRTCAFATMQHTPTGNQTLSCADAIYMGTLLVGVTVASVALNANGAEGPSVFPVTNPPSGQESYPLAEAQAQRTDFPFDGTPVAAPDGFPAQTVPGQTVHADPLPAVDPRGHLYLASRAGTTVEIVGKEGTYTIGYDSQGYPDFSPYAIAQVKINMKGNYTSDFTEANKAAGYKRTPAGYTWHHHQDGETMQLVPTDLHKRVFHYGGVNTVKNK